MDISGLDSRHLYSVDLGEALKVADTKASKLAKAYTPVDTSTVVSDSADIGSFEAIKNTVRNAPGPASRVELLAELKAKFKAGELNFDSLDIAEAMFADGTADVLKAA